MVCISVFSCDSHTNPADRINPCFQRLTYEEKMARRLLGADNAATVLNSQETEEEPVTQVWWLFFRIHTPGRGNHTHTHSPEIIQARKHLTNMSTPAAFTLFLIPPLHVNNTQSQFYFLLSPLIRCWCHTYLMTAGFPSYTVELENTPQLQAL